jgi:hypothetical protein
MQCGQEYAKRQEEAEQRKLDARMKKVDDVVQVGDVVEEKQNKKDL